MQEWIVDILTFKDSVRVGEKEVVDSHGSLSVSLSVTFQFSWLIRLVLLIKCMVVG